MPGDGPNTIGPKNGRRRSLLSPREQDPSIIRSQKPQVLAQTHRDRARATSSVWGLSASRLLARAIQSGARRPGDRGRWRVPSTPT